MSLNDFSFMMILFQNFQQTKIWLEAIKRGEYLMWFSTIVVMHFLKKLGQILNILFHHNFFNVCLLARINIRVAHWDCAGKSLITCLK